MAHQCEHWRLPCTCPTPKRVDFVINRWSFPDSLGWANFSWPWNLSRNLRTRFYQVGAWEIKIIICFFLPIIFSLLIFRDILLLRHGVATIKTDGSVGRKVPSCKKTFFCSEDLGIAHLQCNDINREYFYFWLLACLTSHTSTLRESRGSGSKGCSGRENADPGVWKNLIFRKSLKLEENLGKKKILPVGTSPSWPLWYEEASPWIQKSGWQGVSSKI